MIKRVTQGPEGKITHHAFRIFGKNWIIAISETKWHAGAKFRKTPIWFSEIGGGIPAIFIGKIAIGFDNRKEESK
jgi:hypothetical protein